MRAAEKYLLETIDIYLHRCQQYNLKLKISKCNFYMKEVEWCGHLISGKGISIAPTKMKALTAVPVPKNAGELMQYICALNFLRNKIPMFSEIVSPLRRFLTKNAWTGQHAAQKPKQPKLSSQTMGGADHQINFMISHSRKQRKPWPMRSRWRNVTTRHIPSVYLRMRLLNIGAQF